MGILYDITSTSSTAQGGGGSFKNRKPIGEFLKGKKHFQDVIVTSFKGHCPLRPVSCASPRWTKEIEHHILVQIIWIRVPKVMAYLNCRYPGKHCILNHFELLGLFPHQRNKGLPVNLWITFQPRKFHSHCLAWRTQWRLATAWSFPAAQICGEPINTLTCSWSKQEPRLIPLCAKKKHMMIKTWVFKRDTRIHCVL